MADIFFYTCVPWTIPYHNKIKRNFYQNSWNFAFHILSISCIADGWTFSKKKCLIVICDYRFNYIPLLYVACLYSVALVAVEFVEIKTEIGGFELAKIALEFRIDGTNKRWLYLCCISISETISKKISRNEYMRWLYNRPASKHPAPIKIFIVHKFQNNRKQMMKQSNSCYYFSYQFILNGQLYQITWDRSENG